MRFARLPFRRRRRGRNDGRHTGTLSAGVGNGGPATRRTRFDEEESLPFRWLLTLREMNDLSHDAPLPSLNRCCSARQGSAILAVCFCRFSCTGYSGFIRLHVPARLRTRPGRHRVEAPRHPGQANKTRSGKSEAMKRGTHNRILKLETRGGVVDEPKRWRRARAQGGQGHGLRVRRGPRERAPPQLFRR